ncbi:MAG: aspartate aminotransferase family protein, partial [Nannocystaceae bacterium]
MDELRWPTYKTRSITLDRPLDASARGSAYVVDTDGREYLDCVGGIGCAPLGHADPRWVTAISTQLGKISAAANSYRTAPQRAFATALLERMPISDARVFLCSTGTESTEAAIKLAIKATGRDVIISFDRAFHGRSLGALSLTANPAYRTPYVRCEGEDASGAFAQMQVVRAPFGDLEAVQALCARYQDRVAAIFLEPIQGEAGIFPATREFLLGLRSLCDTHGALLGIDEIQSGCGRTGHFTAWETLVGDAAEPDIIWMAKALGGGFPVAACIARTDVAAA